MEAFAWWVWPILLYIGGIAAAADALWQGRTAQGTAAWVLALILMPLVALPVYLFFGSRRFRGYRRARRKKDSRLAQRQRQIRKILTEAELSPDATTLPLQRLFRVPMLDGNDTQLLINGHDTFNAILNTGYFSMYTLRRNPTQPTAAITLYTTNRFAAQQTFLDHVPDEL